MPLHEGIERYEDHGENFYYPQEDFLFELSSKRSWDWNVIRPMGIIGYTPAGMFRMLRPVDVLPQSRPLPWIAAHMRSIL